jgi:hypothetical protein
MQPPQLEVRARTFGPSSCAEWSCCLLGMLRALCQTPPSSAAKEAREQLLAAARAAVASLEGTVLCPHPAMRTHAAPTARSAGVVSLDARRVAATARVVLAVTLASKDGAWCSPGLERGFTIGCCLGRVLAGGAGGPRRVPRLSLRRRPPDLRACRHADGRHSCPLRRSVSAGRTSTTAPPALTLDRRAGLDAPLAAKEDADKALALLAEAAALLRAVEDGSQLTAVLRVAARLTASTAVASDKPLPQRLADARALLEEAEAVAQRWCREVRVGFPRLPCPLPLTQAAARGRLCRSRRGPRPLACQRLPWRW